MVMIVSFKKNTILIVGGEGVTLLMPSPLTISRN